MPLVALAYLGIPHADLVRVFPSVDTRIGSGFARTRVVDRILVQRDFGLVERDKGEM